MSYCLLKRGRNNEELPNFKEKQIIIEMRIRIFIVRYIMYI